MTDVKTEPSAAGPPVQKKEAEPSRPERAAEDTGVPASGRRAAFRDVRRQLSEEDLAAPGVQKLILDMLQEADEDREYLRSFVNLYHESDKKAAVLAEKLLTHKSIEVFFGVGIALGGTIIGLVPFLWATKPEYGFIGGFVGLALLVGATVGRMVKK